MPTLPGPIRRTRLLAVLACSFALAAGTAAPAEAGTPFSLGSGGLGGDVHGAVDSAGTLHAAWLFDGPALSDEKIQYCRVPRGAQACSGAPQDLSPPGGDGDSPFVLIDGATLYVVVHRYVQGDVLVWTSIGGAPFLGPSTRATGTFGTDSTEPIFGPVANTITIGTSNPDDYVQNVPLSGAVPNTVATLDDQGFIFDTQVGLSGSTLIAAGWKINSSAKNQVAFFRYTGANTTGGINTSASWTGPNVVADGADSRLAGGPSGLFLLTSSYRPGESLTDQFQVRKFDGSAFGAPINVGSPETGYFPDFHQSPSGALLAAWRRNGDPHRLRLSTSTNGGASFPEPVDIVRGEEGGYDDLDVAAAADGQGFAVWKGAGATIRAASLEPLPPLPPTAGGGDSTDPVVEGLDIGDPTLTPGQGTKFSFTSSEAGTARLLFEKAGKGLKLRQRRKLRCLGRTKKRLRKLRKSLARTKSVKELKGRARRRKLAQLIRKRGCTAYKRIGSITQAVTPGRNEIVFTGKIAGRSLSPGRYRATLTVQDGAGNASAKRTVNFRVIGKGKKA